MRLNSILAIAASITLSSQFAFATDYTVDKAHSSVKFDIRHMMTKVSGEFKDFDGEFSYDEKNPEKSQVKFVAQAKSVSTSNDKRDDHLRSEDFFDVSKHPTLSFTSTKVVKAGKNKAKVTGDLTMHGVTKATTFDVEFLGKEKDPWGNERAGFSATSKINRKDFKIIWNKALDSGSLLLGDEVTVEVQVEGLPKKAAGDEKKDMKKEEKSEQKSDKKS